MIDKLLSEAKYNFAKSMPDIPHYYTLKQDWEDKEAFLEAVKYINANGKKGKFYNKPFTYYFADGWKYWTMSNENEAELINRERVNE